jgi:hypothetical protein
MFFFATVYKLRNVLCNLMFIAIHFEPKEILTQCSVILLILEGVC